MTLAACAGGPAEPPPQGPTPAVEGPAPEPPPPVLQPAAMPLAVDAWHPRFVEALREPLQQLDDVDRFGFDHPSCDALSVTLRGADEALAPCLDATVDDHRRALFEAIEGAGAACKDHDQDAWAIHLLSLRMALEAAETYLHMAHGKTSDLVQGERPAGLALTRTLELLGGVDPVPALAEAPRRGFDTPVNPASVWPLEVYEVRANRLRATKLNWRVAVHNRGTSPQAFDLEVQLVDRDGLEVTSGHVRGVVLGADEARSFTDAVRVTRQDGRRIRAVRPVLTLK